MFSFVASLGQVVAPTGAREQIIEAIRLKRERRAVYLAELYDLGDLETENSSLGLPLLYAACAQDLGEVVTALVEKRGANVEGRLKKAGPKALAGDAPLHVCARAGARRAAAALLRLGASMDAVNAEGLDVQSVATRHLLGSASTDVRALVEENKALRARLAASTDSAPRTPPPRREEASAVDDKVRRLRMVQTTTGVFRRKDLVLAACSDTAKAFASPANEYHRVKKVFDALCAAKVDDDHLEALVDRIKADETLRNARACASSAYDGASLLHAVAAKGRERVVERLLRPDVGFSASETLDTMGRTALHVAAENGHVETCIVLKAAMERETGKRPVGDDAPADLSGRTPLAWASDRVHDLTTRDALEEQLFAYGDATVLPRTPLVQPPRDPFSSLDDGAGDLVRPTGYAACATAGWRVDMEDAHCSWSPMPQPKYVGEEKDALPPRPSLFAVLDGHGGRLCAQLASTGLLEAVQETDAWRDYEMCRLRGQEDVEDADRFADALVQGLSLLDRRLAKHPRLALSRTETRGRGDQKNISNVVFKAEDCSGTTCVVALVSSSSVVVANLGDSAAVEIQRLPRRFWRRHADWTASPLSVPHKPDNPLERQRIEAFGAKVVDGYVRLGRQGQGTSRSLGDFQYKQRNVATEDLDHAEGAVSAEADIHIIDRNENSFLLLATDGLWDVLEPQQKAADLLQAQLEEGKREDGEENNTAVDLQAAVDSLVATCVTARSRDNITAILVDLNADLGDGRRRDPSLLLDDNRPNKDLFGAGDQRRQSSSLSNVSDSEHPSF